MQPYNGTPSTFGLFGGTSTGIFGAHTSSTQSNSNFGAPSGFGQVQNPSNNQFTQPRGSIFSGTSTGIFGTSSSPLPANGSSVFGQPNSVFGTSSFTPSAMSPFSSSGFGFNSNSSSVMSTTSPSSSTGFGFNSNPSSSSNWFGLTSSPSAGFNFHSSPSLSSTGFGLNVSPSTGFSFGSSPSFSSTGFGLNSSASTGFGINSSPSTGFSFSSSSSFSCTGFGLNSSPSTGFGFNLSPNTGFGINSSPSTGFGFNSSPSTGFGFNYFPSTGFSFNSSPAVSFKPQTYTSNSAPSMLSTPSTGFPSNSRGFFQPTSSFPGSSAGCQVSTPPYSKTILTEGAETRSLVSISGMPVYNDQNSKSHEELRWENKGGSQIGSTSTTTVNPKPFTSFTPTNNNIFNHQNTSSWPSSPQPNNDIYNNNQNTSLCPSSSQPNNSSTPVNTVTPSSLFPQTTNQFKTATSSVSGPSNTSPSRFNFDGYKFTPSTPVQPSVHTPWPTQQITTLPPSTTTVTNVSPTQTTLPGLTGFIGVNKPAQVSVEPTVTHLAHPFASEPARQPLYISRDPAQSLYRGISSIPVHDKQEVPVRHSISLLTARCLSQRRHRLPLHKHNTKISTQKVPFFIDDCQVTPLFPRENLKDFITPKRNPKESSSQPAHKSAEATLS